MLRSILLADWSVTSTVLAGLSGALASLLAACWSALTLYLKVKAERKLVRAIRAQRPTLVHEIELLHAGKMSPEDFDRLVREIAVISAELPASSRNRVTKALLQPSEEGRAEYVQKLMSQVEQPVTR